MPVRAHFYFIAVRKYFLVRQLYSKMQPVRAIISKYLLLYFIYFIHSKQRHTHTHSKQMHTVNKCTHHSTHM